MKENLNFRQLYFIINISFNILKNILLSVAMTMRLNSIDKQSKTLPKLDDNFFIHTKQQLSD
jgi:hypothetical protein